MGKRFISVNEAISLLPEGDTIHTFYNTGLALLGADWQRQDVIDKLAKSDKIEITGDTARSMNHGLAAYNDDIKYQSDILFIETDKEKLDKFDLEENEESNDGDELLSMMPKQIKCGECIHWDTKSTGFNFDDLGSCKIHGGLFSNKDWYCADAENNRANNHEISHDSQTIIQEDGNEELGEWIITNILGHFAVECSNCGFPDGSSSYKFCPICGERKKVKKHEQH